MNRNKIIEEIEIEFTNLDELFNEIIAFPDIVKNKEINNYDKAAIALMLSQLFNGIENVLKRVLELNSIKLIKKISITLN